MQRFRNFHKAIIFLATMCGLGPICLLPMFAIRAFIERSKERAFQALTLTLGLLTQIIFFVRLADRNVGGGKDAAFGIDPMLLLNIFFVKHIISPILGYQEATKVAGNWIFEYAHGSFNLLPGAVACIATAAVFGFLIWKSPKPETKWLVLAGLGLASLSYFGALADRYNSLGVGVNSRYAYAPQILFEFSLLSIAASTKGWKSFLSKNIIIWLLVVGMHEYFFVSPFYSEGPSWPSQIKLWQQDPSHEIKLWPDSWVMKLTPHK